MKFLDRLLGRLLCLTGHHDLHAACEGLETIGPPEGHVCRPVPGDTSEIALTKFSEWTRLRCARCAYAYPGIDEWPGGGI